MKGKEGTGDPGGPAQRADAIRPEAGSVRPQKKVFMLMFLHSKKPIFTKIHRERSTGDLHFRNQGSRNDWVWVQARTEEMYGALRGRLPAKPVALLKIMDYRSDDTVRRVAGVQMLTPAHSWRLSDQHGLVKVQMREDSRGFTIVDIGTILALAHLIQEGN